MIHNLSQIAHNGRQFMLKTTDQKIIQVVLSQPVRNFLRYIWNIKINYAKNVHVR